MLKKIAYLLLAFTGLATALFMIGAFAAIGAWFENPAIAPSMAWYSAGAIFVLTAGFVLCLTLDKKGRI